ncbi:MAG TPA: hypothetical protein VHT73_12775 [Thermodesulfobacteriota bacterium]|nr:hypothetical protein [Thermodesulfobacteriota bacterium]
MTQKTRIFPLCSLLMLFLILTGCAAKLERNYPQRNYYILNVSNTNGNSSPASDGILEIRRFTISPNFTTREFVYRKGDLSYVSDFYNQFFRPPGMLITEETRKWLSESGLFKYVLDSSNSARPDYVLEGNVNELYGDYRTSGTPKAVLGIQFFLIDETSPNSQIIFQKNYYGEVALKNNSPETLVEGWNNALEQILTDLKEDLMKLDLTKSRFDNQV